MSIPIAASSTQPLAPSETMAAALVLVLLLLTVLSPAIAWALGVFRTDHIVGRSRYGPDDSALKFFLIVFLGYFGMMAAGTLVYLALPGLAKSQREFTAGLIGSSMGFFIVLVLNLAMREDAIGRLGLQSKGMGRGFLAGFVGLVIVLPWLYWLGLVAELLRRKFMPELPTEHQIFTMWRGKETSQALRIIAFLSATIGAPLTEEILFRGVLQTGLARLFTRRKPLVQAEPIVPPSIVPSAETPPEQTIPGVPPLPPSPEAMQPVPVVPIFAPFLPAPPPIPSAGARWAAILVTAALFAVLHPPFSWPMILLLAVGLGYVYERTGNLWAPIFMHLLFNGFQFMLFLLMMASH